MIFDLANICSRKVGALVCSRSLTLRLDLFLVELWQSILSMKALYQTHCELCTVWKFHDFSITQILREINFGESSSSKKAFLGNFRCPKICYIADFALLGSLKLISRKIWVIEKLWNFHTMIWTFSSPTVHKWEQRLL